MIVVQHVSKNIFCVLESLGHLCVVAVKSLIEWHCRSFALLVHIGHKSIFRVQEDLRVVLEVNLNNLVAESEHDGVLGPHPFLNVN